MEPTSSMGFDYAAPAFGQEKIQLAHGGGGRLMHQLIDGLFSAILIDPDFGVEHDGAVFESHGTKMAFTTDSFVVHPLFFPGGDIGTLAVYGTVNDLAMCGACPLYLSAGFIIEEGFEIKYLRRIAQSMRAAADIASIKIVTGDTKVVDRGKGHGVFINTAGIGVVDHDLDIGPGSIEPGDVIILSGDIGRHGIAVMAEREGLSFESRISSDVAPLAEPVARLIESGAKVHCLRDLTRGGLATVLVELATSSGKGIQIEERNIPVCEEVKGACEILGLDPLYVANEGRFVTFVPANDSDTALEIMQSSQVESCVIGSVTDTRSGLVTIRTHLGTERMVDMLSGEQLPRIC